MRRRRPGRRERRILRADVERVLSGILNGAHVEPHNFFVLLPTEQARKIAQTEFSSQFHSIFGFTGVGPFARENPIAFFQEHPPRHPFEPPDLHHLERGEAYRAATAARAAWWIANGLPLSHREMAWLEKHREELKNGTRPN